MASWFLAPDYGDLAVEFGSLEAVFALQGERLTKDPMSEVILLERAGVRYYVKRYWSGGKGLRRYLGRPRIKAEWQNLKYFAKWGIATAPIVAYGLERRWGCFERGALITRELINTEDLGRMARYDDPRLGDRQWVDVISRQLALATRTLHGHRFTHNDLKWRNLLVNDRSELFLIDCPGGSFWWGPALRYRIVKDLACLDKVGKQKLSQTQRLRFYLQYCGRVRLTAGDKRRIRQIVGFFEGRE
ncbi:lipopolysaccharide kinase InaA family protein [Pseudomonas xionganensis]|uniref:Heptose kinase n=1 Tax=Pseudomonas xionganensis TaxID=2654845 RepID=A0A6I4KV89_9PSED|nr:lipopolysaccharide kinase InaA family protein [Pseudomonas xionganensis]MVW74632.1 heptose kinase [Pseudomonas xionganensis]